MKIDNSVPAVVPFAAQIAGTTKWATASGKIEFYSTSLATTDPDYDKMGRSNLPNGRVSRHTTWLQHPLFRRIH